MIWNVRERKGQESLLLTHFILVLLQDARAAQDVNISLISHIALNLSYLSCPSSLPPALKPLSHPHIPFLSVPPHWHIFFSGSLHGVMGVATVNISPFLSVPQSLSLSNYLLRSLTHRPYVSLSLSSSPPPPSTFCFSHFTLYMV